MKLQQYEWMILRSIKSTPKQDALLRIQRANASQRLKWLAKLIVAWCCLSFSQSAFAQTLDVPAGLWTDTFLTDVKGEKAIVVPGNSTLVNETKAATDAVITSMYKSQAFSVVMDSAPLGALEQLDDAQRLEKARAADQSLACLVAAYPAPESHKIVITCTKKDDSRIEFIGTANDPNSFFLNKRVSLKPKEDKPPAEVPEENERVGSNILALNTLTTAKAVAFNVKEQSKEGARKMLAHSPTRLSSRRIVAGVGEPIGHDVFYELTGRADLADIYRSRSTTKMTLYIVSSVLLAAGAGLTFVGLTANSGCEGFGCKTTLIPVSGIAALVLGGVGITWGFLIKKYPTSIDEDLKSIDDYNREL